MKKKKKVVLALSGGVDSALAATLLVEEGYEVIAAFMKNWSDTKTVQGECSWKEERRDAIRVAAKLGIPFATFDFEKEYRQHVVGYLFKEYAAGRTPNPDIFCNSEVKFPLFWREAKKLGADLIATGHHVSKRQRSKGKSQKWELIRGVDENKDQTYFLHRLSQEDLEHTLFPIGKYTKEEVRNMARERGLINADKRSTRGICFVGKVSMPDFLSQAIKSKPGQIVDRSGKKIGAHQGIEPFTIGQRHGFGSGGGKTMYVVGKDVKKNTLIVGDENDPALNPTEIKIKDLYFILGEKPKFPFECMARIRYRNPLVGATIYDDFIVKFEKSVWAPAPGQYVVFYDKDVCLGGAEIA